ncbi:hypothetical protein [Deminuibacter soli]|uniref:NEAT domain-containing protein n=1 Tax=Deminuibacter soli TaxID=2291815 RepID=A0A3E1NQ75_9BACT|nr:hypothetical protein [Deminuibacter soli]RFM29948.1 hypothetical protein DXN05_02960 [Deminuibacter soli]
MKKQSFRVVLKQVLMAAGIAAVVTLALPASSKANTYNNSVDSVGTSVKKAEIQYLGTYDNSVWFNINFANPNANKFEIIIKNDENEVLYQGKFSDKNFSKKVKILKEQDEMKPTFILRSQDNETEQRFVINSATRLIEEVVVTKL